MKLSLVERKGALQSRSIIHPEILALHGNVRGVDFLRVKKVTRLSRRHAYRSLVARETRIR